MFGQGITSGVVSLLFAAATVNAIPLVPEGEVRLPTRTYLDVMRGDDRNGSCNGTETSGLLARANGCAPPLPTATFDCKPENGRSNEEACKGMCWNRYCKGGTGAWPSPFHRGLTSQIPDRRASGGFKSASSKWSPCKAGSAAPENFNIRPQWTSMDEFPMASWHEGGAHGDWGAGFRCILASDNSRAGSRMRHALDAADVRHGEDPVDAVNGFHLAFKNYEGLDVDWCNVDDDGEPVSRCENDGNQFIARVNDDVASGFDYVLVNDGLGWTGVAGDE